MAERTIPSPAIHPEVEPFFTAANAGKLMLKVCVDCDQAFYYPRALCPFCASSRTEWREASGKGEIYAWTVLRRANPPYAVASVALAEGPNMLANVVDCDFDAMRSGLPVTVVFQASDNGQMIPMFTPASGH